MLRPIKGNKLQLAWSDRLRVIDKVNDIYCIIQEEEVVKEGVKLFLAGAVFVSLVQQQWRDKKPVHSAEVTALRTLKDKPLPSRANENFRVSKIDLVIKKTLERNLPVNREVTCDSSSTHRKTILTRILISEWIDEEKILSYKNTKKNTDTAICGLEKGKKLPVLSSIK